MKRIAAVAATALAAPVLLGSTPALAADNDYVRQKSDTDPGNFFVTYKKDKVVKISQPTDASADVYEASWSRTGFCTVIDTWESQATENILNGRVKASDTNRWNRREGLETQVPTTCGPDAVSGEFSRTVVFSAKYSYRNKLGQKYVATPQLRIAITGGYSSFDDENVVNVRKTGSWAFKRAKSKSTPGKNQPSTPKPKPTDGPDVPGGTTPMPNAGDSLDPNPAPATPNPNGGGEWGAPGTAGW